jgi:hypothetical protein
MASDTFLQLVSAVITETGLNGSEAPSDVETAEGDAAKVVYWVSVADAQIQRERIDWDFLWAREDAPLTEGNAVVPSPSEQWDANDINTKTVLVNSIAKNRLAIIDANGQSHFPTFLHWNEFSVIYGYETQEVNDYPSNWTIRPDRVILLSNPILSPDQICRYEFWRKPIKLRQNGDVSRIPDDFDRLIVLLSKVLYAEHEDAPEVDAGSSVNYDLMLNQMISVHAPDAEWQRMENSDVYLQVETR